MFSMFRLFHFSDGLFQGCCISVTYWSFLPLFSQMSTLPRRTRIAAKPATSEDELPSFLKSWAEIDVCYHLIQSRHGLIHDHIIIIIYNHGSCWIKSCPWNVCPKLPSGKAQERVSDALAQPRILDLGVSGGRGRWNKGKYLFLQLMHELVRIFPIMVE